MARAKNRYDEAAERAAQMTNEELADELARMTFLSDEEVRQYFPARVDREALAEILSVVNQATSRNTKVAALRRDFDRLGNAVVTLLELTLRA